MAFWPYWWPPTVSYASTTKPFGIFGLHHKSQNINKNITGIGFENYNCLANNEAWHCETTTTTKLIWIANWPMAAWSCEMIFNHTILLWDTINNIYLDRLRIDYQKKNNKEFLLFLRWISFYIPVCGFANFFYHFFSFLLFFPVSLSFFSLVHYCSSGYRIELQQQKKINICYYYYSIPRRQKTKKKEKEKEKRYKYIHMYTNLYEVVSYFFFLLCFVDQDRFSMLLWTLSNWPYVSFRQFYDDALWAREPLAIL